MRKFFFCSEIIAFELVALNTRFYCENILVIRCQYANKECQNFRYLRKAVFGAHFLREWSKNITKTLRFWFKQCFHFNNMLTVYKRSNTELFENLNKSAFSSLKFQKKITCEAEFFLKLFQILCSFQICRQKFIYFSLILR